MKYFKIIKDNIIIGAITSQNFMRYLSITDCFIRATEQEGEYVTYNGQFYRATWMHPIIKNVKHIDAMILAIQEEEYNAIIEAIQSNEVIEEDLLEEEQEEIRQRQEEAGELPNPIDELTIEFIRSSKLNELSYACQKRIEAGFNWGDKHYSLTKEDQINLLNAQLMINSGETSVLYHADGEDYRYFNAEEILALVERATNWRLDHTIYLKSLKQRVNAATTIEEIAAITYEK